MKIQNEQALFDLLNETSAVDDAGFTDRVMSRVESENTLLLKERSLKFRTKVMLITLAIAMSICGFGSVSIELAEESLVGSASFLTGFLVFFVWLLSTE